MKPGLSSNHFRSFSVAHAIEAAHRLKYAGVEIWAEHLWESGEDPAALRRTAEAHRLSLSVHGPICEVNVTSRNAGIREESCRQYRRAIDDAARLGASTVVLHPGSRSPGDESSVLYWEALVGCFAALGDQARRLDLRVGVEHMERRPREYVTHPDDVLRLLQAVGNPALGLTLDIAHLLFSGQTAVTGSLEPYLLEVHISGSNTTHTHVPLREGIYDVQAVLRTLSTFYHGMVVIEGRTPGREMETVISNRQEFAALVDGFCN